MLLHDGLDFDQITVPHPADDQEEVILVKSGGVVQAFLNRCPHAGATLDWGNGRCLEPDGRLLCSMHGARFDAATGDCVDGPALGRCLERVPIQIDGERILFDARS
jgi:nitrite reductase/ring-hydroxylating ferredoxin subunit